MVSASFLFVSNVSTLYIKRKEFCKKKASDHSEAFSVVLVQKGDANEFHVQKAVIGFAPMAPAFRAGEIASSPHRYNVGVTRQRLKYAFQIATRTI